MGMQTTQNTGTAGKTQQPPAPTFEGTTKPLALGEVQNTKPLAVDMGAVTPAPASGMGPQPIGGATPTFVTGNTEADKFDYSKQNPAAIAGAFQATGNGQNLMGGATGPGGTPAGAAPGGTAGGGGGGGGGGGAVFGGGFGAGAVPSAIDDASRRRVEEAILSRLEPQFRQDSDRMRNQLLSSGLEVGSPAYTSELDRLARAQNDARMQAVLAGGQEESRQVGMNANLQGQAFSQGLQGAQFDNATRQQMLAELLMQRNTPLNELNALRTGSQVSMPQFGGYYTNNAQAAPIFDAATAQGNYDLTRAQQEQSGFNSMLGGLATLGGAGIMKFSDIRLKRNINRIGQTAGGIPLYSWTWADGSGSDTGVLAQEVMTLVPGAVVEDTSGFLMVDYSKIH